MKTEKEKMLAGELYDGNFNLDLEKERIACKDLCLELNNAPYREKAKQQELVRKLFGKCGKNFAVMPPVWCDYGYNVEIGENFFSNHNLVILDPAKVIFGDNVFVGPNCCFATAGHPLDAETRNKGLEFARPIKVGNNVWFGAGVTVLPGVTIGDGCVIAAGSVVISDLPANSVAAGVPAVVKKHIEQ